MRPLAATLSVAEVDRRLAEIEAARRGRASAQDTLPGCVLDDDERERRLHALRQPVRPLSMAHRRLGMDEAQTRARGGEVLRIDGACREGESTLGDTWDDDPGISRAADADFGTDRDAPAFRRWPATLHPDAAERCYYNARERSKSWVGDLRTRTGVLRWDRIRRCGDPVAVMRVGDGAVSWEHRWCRDRACYSCARSRSRRLATELRTSIETRPNPERLYFVTLTQPRAGGESCSAAIDRWVRSWTALRHHPCFKDLTGGVRVTEVTWSNGHERAKHRIPGWHVHGHLLVELKHAPCFERCPACLGSKLGNGGRCRTCGSRVVLPRGDMPDALVAVLSAWSKIASAVPQAQCAVPLDRENVGQLAKYLTKLWELRDGRARELFDAAAGRRIVEGFGAWRGWRRFGGDVERTPRGWVSCSIALRALESLSPATPVDFCMPIGLTLEADGRASWRPVVPVARSTAGAVLHALRGDARPSWERAAEGTPPECAAALAALSRTLAAMRREVCRGVLGPLRAGAATITPWPRSQPSV